jgi:hypothetical protein
VPGTSGICSEAHDPRRRSRGIGDVRIDLGRIAKDPDPGPSQPPALDSLTARTSARKKEARRPQPAGTCQLCLED